VLGSSYWDMLYSSDSLSPVLFLFTAYAE